MPPFNQSGYVEPDVQRAGYGTLDSKSDLSRAQVEGYTTTDNMASLGFAANGSDYQETSPTQKSSLENSFRTQGHTQSGTTTHPNPSTAAGLSHMNTTSQYFEPPPSSSIFERSVQESTLPIDAAPAIPAHMKTEDLIPPALEASSLAITDNHLKPDDVEIVTHAAHQPAAAALTDSVSPGLQSDSHLPLSHQSSQNEVLPASQHQDGDETASNYGALDPNDVRRLSFISFADVVQAEHAELGSRESVPYQPNSLSQNRAQSPVKKQASSPARSPASQTHSFPRNSAITPPAGIDAVSQRGFDLSPTRSQASSPTGAQQHGDLVLTTMSQALRTTASGDVSTAWSHPTSATSTEDVTANPFK